MRNEDKHIVPVVPWMDGFSIIGTTDVEYRGDPKTAIIDDKEINYLLNVYSMHLRKILNRNDIVWTYSGVRPLCDDESDSSQMITRDYALDVHDENDQTSLLSIFGEKLIIYRKLAEHVPEKLTPYYRGIGPIWIKTTVLPGGDIGDDRNDYVAKLRRRFLFIGESLACHYTCIYGSNSERILKETSALSDLGEDSGHEFYEAELKYLVEYKWVRSLDDAIWHRTRQGM